jgi:hypothetical protein
VITLALCAGLIATLVLGRQVGAASPPPPDSINSWLRTHSKIGGNAWCLFDICPGQTPMDAAEHTMRTAGATLLRQSEALVYWNVVKATHWHVEVVRNASQSRVISMTVHPERSPLTLGDILLTYGDPTAITRFVTPRTTVTWVCFERHLCAALLGRWERPLNLHTKVEQIAYSLYATFPFFTPWRGLGHYAPLVTVP